jgi:hypothetical protein
MNHAFKKLKISKKLIRIEMAMIAMNFFFIKMGNPIQILYKYTVIIVFWL